MWGPQTNAPVEFVDRISGLFDSKVNKPSGGV